MFIVAILTALLFNFAICLCLNLVFYCTNPAFGCKMSVNCSCYIYVWCMQRNLATYFLVLRSKFVFDFLVFAFVRIRRKICRHLFYFSNSLYNFSTFVDFRRYFMLLIYTVFQKTGPPNSWW